MLDKLLAALFIAAWLAPAAFGAVTEDDFKLPGGPHAAADG